MAKKETTLSFNVETTTEERDGYFASRTEPFALTAYGKNEEEAERRVKQALLLLLRQYANTPKQLSDYLNQKGVKHVIRTESDSARFPKLVRTYREEMMVKVPAHA